jgi:PilZ domain
MIVAQSFLGYDQVPWELVVPLTAAVVATGSAFVLSRFFLRPTPAVQLAAPVEKPTAEFDPFVQGSATEQRGAFRRGGKAIEVRISDALQDGKVHTGWILDRSVSGLCLAVSEAFAEGSLLNVRTPNAPNATPWVEIQVKSCRQRKDDWELGCQFLKTPPWSVMLLFG